MGPSMHPDTPSESFRIGPFEALERLGRGGFASVYRARDLRTGQFVALKVVPPGTDPESVRRLMREARAVARVSHRNVVRVYECGVTAEGAYVAMELLVGRTLQDLIDEVGALPVPRALDIALQLLDGLDVAHEHQIVHRDIKPGNIFLSLDAHGKETPHLLDFGVSKLGSSGAGNTTGTSHQDRTLPGTAMGTPGFMAPEQYGSAHAADARADVYGVAATIYTMLTGRLPFDAGTYESWVIKVKGERAPSVAAQAPHIAPELAMAIDRALARDPDARWSTAQEFARALIGHVPAPLGSTARRDRSPAPSYDDETSPLVRRSAWDLPTPSAIDIPSAATSTPRTEQEPTTQPHPHPHPHPHSGAPARQPQPQPTRDSDAGPGGSRSGQAASGSGSGGSVSTGGTRRSAGAPPVQSERKRKSAPRPSGALWFVSGALVGALLAALGAGLALWARSRTAPAPLPAPHAVVDAAVPNPAPDGR